MTLYRQFLPTPNESRRLQEIEAVNFCPDDDNKGESRHGTVIARPTRAGLVTCQTSLTAGMLVASVAGYQPQFWRH
jgi:hypothetical protein